MSQRTVLYDWHARQGAKFTPFAGYDMPVHYPMGVLKEHEHVRARAGLFDVSHMGQIWLSTTEAELGAEDAHDVVAAALETVIPGDVRGLKPGGLRYTVLLNDDGGVLDDLMVTRPARPEKQGYLVLVVNAATKAADEAFLRAALKDRVVVEVQDDRALLALQGPEAAAVLERVLPGVDDQSFMTMRPFDWEGAYLLVSRCGYTGEDGFEVSIPKDKAVAFAERLSAEREVAPIGLGARDSLRLEAGLCLYGQDMDTDVTPVEANIAFTLSKRRREAADFPGAARILRDLRDGPERLRVGLAIDGRGAARTGAEVVHQGTVVGRVTSGAFAPSLGHAVAMAYVPPDLAAPETALNVRVRGKSIPARVTPLPFRPARYVRKASA